MNSPDNIFPDINRQISRADKEQLLTQKGKTIWMTGLSGSGKTTLAIALEKVLHDKGIISQVLDGDNIRAGINSNLGFSNSDREENIRRIAEVSKLFVSCGIITINCFVSPTRKIRELAKSIIGQDDFMEIYINSPLEVCESRDVKGLYKKARSGQIPDFTGVNSEFEPPDDPALEVNSSELSIQESLNLLTEYLLPIVSVR